MAAHDSAPLVEQTLTRSASLRLAFFRPEAVARLLQAHIVERKYEMWPLWTTCLSPLVRPYIDRSLTLDHRLALLTLRCPQNLCPSDWTISPRFVTKCRDMTTKSRDWPHLSELTKFSGEHLIN